MTGLCQCATMIMISPGTGLIAASVMSVPIYLLVYMKIAADELRLVRLGFAQRSFPDSSL